MFNLFILKRYLVLFSALLLLLFACQKGTEKEQSEMPAVQEETAVSESDSATVVTEPLAEVAPTPESETEKTETVPEPAAEPEKTPAPATQKSEVPPAATAKAEVELVPIDIKLPRPMFVGTPQPMQVPNLEKPLGKARPPFLAPAGTKNVAFKKAVASTDEAPIIGDIAMITDGDKEATDGSYVELGPFEQHVTIDLEKKHNIYAIVVWHFHKQARVYYDVIVQVADDPDFIANVQTIFNNDVDNSSGLGVGKDMHYVETAEGKLIDAKGVQARYVRLHSKGNTGNDLNHYIEVEVYGKPVE